jgi:hypothetical protein
MDVEEIFQFCPEGNAESTLGVYHAKGESIQDNEEFGFRIPIRIEPTAEQILEAQSLKEEGNSYFQRKEYFEALISYTQALVSNFNTVISRQRANLLHESRIVLQTSAYVARGLRRCRNCSIIQRQNAESSDTGCRG